MIARSPMLSLPRFAWTVARDVNRTLGGGLASMELLRRTFTGNGALDDQASNGLIAVSRLTPGTNVLAYCVCLGWHVHRWTGALAALAAASMPASLAILLLTLTLVRVDHYPAVRTALAAGVLVAALLVFSSAWFLVRPYLQTSRLRLTAAIVMASCGLLLAGITPVRILLVAAVIGAVLGDRATTSETR
jgi:chromate transporter